MNDFEAPVFKQYPEIETIKHKLVAAGATYAAMSGSGSSVWALFEPNVAINPLQFSDHYLVKHITL